MPNRKMVKQMKLSMTTALNLAQGLAFLDGYERVYKDGQGIERMARSGYTFSAKIKLIIALNRKRLRDVVDIFSTQRTALFTALSEGNESLEDKAKIETFKKQEKELLDHEEDVQLTMIGVDDLRLDDENNRNISPGVLVLLAPILTGFDDTPTS